MKRIIGLTAVAVLILGACGGGGDEPAAFEDVAVNQCVDAPVTVPSISILGQRVQSVSELQVCTDVKASAGIIPEISEYDDCGDPCYAVIVRDFDIAADAAIKITYKSDGVPQETSYDPEPVNQEVGNGRLCIAGVGGPPDPCTERITTPRSLSATPARRQISLQWRSSVDTGNDNLMGYELWRSTDGQTYAHVGTVGETTFVDTDVTRGQRYWYFVVAFDEEGNHSQQSNVVETQTK